MWIIGEKEMPMSYGSNGSIRVRWMVNLWVKDPLGACVTYQFKKKKNEEGEKEMVRLLKELSFR